MAEELEIDEEGKSSTSSKKKLIIIVVAAVVLLGGAGAGAYLMFAGGEPEQAVAEEGESSEVDAASNGEKKEELKKLNPDELPAPALYFNMEPELVINLAPDSEQSYLVVKVSLMTRDEAVIGIIESNYPLLRSLIIEILASQRSQELRTFQGKNKLKETILSEVQTFMKQEIGIKILSL